MCVNTLAIPSASQNKLRIHSYSGPLKEDDVSSEFADVNSLEIRLSNITEFSKEVLQKFEQLKSLNIAFSNIYKTEEAVFENCCPKLKTLEIQNWKNFSPTDLKGIGTLPLEKLEILDEDIPILKDEMFENRELKELRLIRDKIETVDSQAFKNLINLEYLLFSENKLKHLPKEALSPLKNLITLELVSNGLKKLSTEDIPELPKLKKIIITNENLKEINFENIEKKAPNLNDIYLYGNVGVKVQEIKAERPIIHNLV